MDRWNLLWNLEANQEVQDPRFARQAEAMFVQDFGLSTEWTWHLWSQRSRAIRFAEWFWGSVDGWLAHLRNPRRR